jgi:MFS family permease
MVEVSPSGNGVFVAAEGERHRRRAVFIVFLVVFIDLLGFGIVLPVLPRYGDVFLAEIIPGGNEAPLTGAMLGLLMSSFSLMQFIFAPIWGMVSDRIGRRPILLLGLAGSVVFYSLFGFASDLGKDAVVAALVLLYVARLGAGVAGATIAAAQAVIADSTPPEKRKHGMALIGAAFGIGFTFGPLLGAGATEFFPDWLGLLGYLAAGLSLIAFVLGARLLPETLRPESTPYSRRWVNFGALRTALASPSVGLPILIFFLATFGFGSFEATLSLLNKDSLHLNENRNFLLFAYVGMVLMLTQGFLYRRLANRLSEATFMTIGLILMGLGVALLGSTTWVSQWPNPPAFGVLLTYQMVSLAVPVVGFAFLTPSVQALISRRSDPTRQGEILGLNQSAASLARILGPFVGLTLYKLHPSHLLPYALGAVVLFVMLPLMPRIRSG